MIKRIYQIFYRKAQEERTKEILGYLNKIDCYEKGGQRVLDVVKSKLERILKNETKNN